MGVYPDIVNILNIAPILKSGVKSYTNKVTRYNRIFTSLPYSQMTEFYGKVR